MRIPKLKIGELEFKLPIVQGAMGVRVSSHPLPAAVAEAGGLGTITSIGLGSSDANQETFIGVSREALVEEIRQSRDLDDGGTDKPLALNVMGALSNVHDLITTAVSNGIKMIVYGAGIPNKLPKIVPDHSIKLIPMINSAKLAKGIIELWQKFYQRAPDAFIVEGPLAGGHLGFSREQLARPEEFSLEKILQAVLKVIRPYEQKLGRRIPVIAAGGIYSGADIARMLHLGAAGVQLGTRFVVTEECPAAAEFKQVYLAATKDDIAIVDSPVGMPGRVIRNNFLGRVLARQVKMKCPYKCIRSCDIKHAGFCIAQALFNAKEGNLEDGLIFAGANVHRVDRIMPVKELMAELVEGIKASTLTLPAPV